MNFTGMLPNMVNLYAVFPKVRKIWRVQAGRQLCPVVVIQVNTSALLERPHQEKQKKPERKDKKSWDLFLLVNQNISWCLTDWKTSNKEVKWFTCLFFKHYILSWVNILNTFNAFLVKVFNEFPFKFIEFNNAYRNVSRKKYLTAFLARDWNRSAQKFAFVNI